ncbi:MAG: Gfo/Idh/MocA family oxidoreductase [Caldilineaceae bacterium]|nr:Gfo/Idh/MocA family oxidoreductase [Caldilineaceae bacterium]
MRVGFVGAGAIARVHATQWLKLPVTLAGCYDRHLDRAEAFSAQYGGQTYASLAELLANVDLVTICTHTDGHKEAVMAAAAARVAMICEKPLARHLHDAQEMVAACEATNTPLFVAQVVRFFPAYARAKQSVAAGTIGTPGVIRTMRAGSYPAAGATFSSPFYGDFARSGGVALDLAIHDIDYHRWIAGDVERVFARGLTYRGLPNADHAYIVLRFRSGAVGHIDANWALPPGLFRTRLEIAGDQGLIEWDSFQPDPLIAAFHDPDHPGQANQSSASPLAAQDDPYFAQLAHVLACLEQKQPFLVTPHDAVMALKVSLAALESMRCGQPIELDSFQEPSP